MPSTRWQGMGGARTMRLMPDPTRHSALLALPERLPRLVARDRLTSTLQSLISGDARILCVWSAAGTGKTTLLAEWVRLLLDSGGDVAWIPGNTLAGASLPAAPGVFVVVDDAHDASRQATEAAIARSLEFGFRLILAGRFQPTGSLAHLAAAGTLLELRTDDLGFTPVEAGELAACHGITLSDDLAADLVVRTGGWATGLALAMPLLTVEHPAHVIDHFLSDHRAVGDYLSSEVIDRCSPAEREILFASAIAARVPADLLGELTGRSDAHRILREHASRNTLVTVTSDEVRYHPVLLSFLQAEARHRDRDRVSAAHAQAAHWYANRGHAVEALHHATASARHQPLAELIDRFALDLVLDGDTRVVQGALGHLQDPDSSLPGTVIRLLFEAPSFADPFRAAALFSRADDAAGNFPFGRWHLILAALHCLHRSPDYTAPDLDILESPRSVALRRASLAVELFCTLAETWQECTSGREHDAIPQLRQISDSAERAGYHWLHLLAAELGATASLAAGEWEQAAAIEDRLVGSATLLSARPTDRARSAATLIVAGRRYQDCQELPSSELNQILADDPHGVAFGLTVPARILLLLPRLDADANPRASVDELDALLRDAGDRFPRLLAESALRLTSLSLTLDGPARALDFAAFLDRVLGADSLETCLARCVIDLPHGRDTHAEHLLAALERRQKTWHAGAVAEAWLFLAHAAHEHGRRVESDLRVMKALESAARFRTIRPFLARGGEGAELVAQRLGHVGHLNDFAGRVVAVAAAAAAAILPHPAVTVERPKHSALTAREHQILRELPLHQSIAAIAASQHLSVNTVKTHVRSIYLKLGVVRRGDAVREATENGLL